MGSSGGIKRQKSVSLGPMVLLQIKPKKKKKHRGNHKLGLTFPFY